MKNLTIKFATRLRGFFKQLVKSNYLDFRIVFNEEKVYETNSSLYNLKVRLIRSRLADWLGLIHRIKFKNNRDIDIVGSYNRFLDTDIPYFIYVENPTALYHYTLNRAKSFLGKRHLNKFLNDSNLRALIFMSKSCMDTFEELVGKIPAHVYCQQIYPLIPDNKYSVLRTEDVETKEKNIKFLYIAQGVRFHSKGGAEVIEAFDRLSKQYSNISLTIVTQLNYCSKDLFERLESHSQIKLQDFVLNQDEMQLLYADSDVLLQPTSDDSFGLTILEALHGGMAIIASSLYSIPEIVKDNYNGFLVEPHYWFFTEGSNLPNPVVWNHRKETIYSKKISERLVKDLVEKMEILISQPDTLNSFKQKSLYLAQNPPFNERFIAKQWNKVIENINSPKY